MFDGCQAGAISMRSAIPNTLPASSRQSMTARRAAADAREHDEQNADGRWPVMPPRPPHGQIGSICLKNLGQAMPAREDTFRRADRKLSTADASRKDFHRASASAGGRPKYQQLLRFWRAAFPRNGRCCTILKFSAPAEISSRPGASRFDALISQCQRYEEVSDGARAEPSSLMNILVPSAQSSRR